MSHIPLPFQGGVSMGWGSTDAKKHQHFDSRQSFDSLETSTQIPFLSRVGADSLKCGDNRVLR